MCVRFSPVHGEVIGSVATDRTARIWSVVSNQGNCILDTKYIYENFFTKIDILCAFSFPEVVYMS